ncbi:MAG TPA: tetratricopeptide repeat protein, partial [Atopostipes sp.]|nr:tetratricopeptide repeat protein [Atopostipes sp.]
FENVDQLNEFMKTMQGKSLDDLPESTTDKGRSQDLVLQAYDETPAKGKKLIKQALELDPNNADAYNYLASVENDVDKALTLYRQAEEAGERALGEEFMEENKGHFWGLIETRPYMRAKAGVAGCLYAKNRVNATIEVYREMIELNPSDNQGVRYLLATILLSKKDLSDYESFVKKYEGEDSALWHYNNALYHFKKMGKSAKSDRELMKAYKFNPYVMEFMLGLKELPDEMPQYIGRGDENEAAAYIYDAIHTWGKTDGALNWMYEFLMERKNVN